ncbi:MAG: tripartite tricarboxylate transporter substrate binding protein, partial [Comamonadaceae bacterium]
MFKTLFACVLAIGSVATAAAQTYPQQPITVVVPFTPGGGTDFLARTVSNKLGEANKWTVVVENKAGAGGAIGISDAIRAEPNGYRIVMGQLDNLVAAPILYDRITYDAARDLTPIAFVGSSPVILVTSADSPYKTLADVVKAAKASPGTITYGSAGTGTTPHLIAEFFAGVAKIDLQHVPYKGSAPALADVMGGQIALLSSSIPSALGQIKAGKLRPLAVTSAKRSSSLPDVPTVAESGYPGFDYATWYGLFAPTGTPASAVSVLNTKTNEVLAMPDVQATMLAQGVEIAPATPQALGQRLNDD